MNYENMNTAELTKDECLALLLAQIVALTYGRDFEMDVQKPIDLARGAVLTLVGEEKYPEIIDKAVEIAAECGPMWLGLIPE